MRQQYIKNGKNKLFAIVEDERNSQTPVIKHTQNLHRYEVRLDKLSQATNVSLKNDSGK
jgi:hypothetical protein